MGVGVGWSGVAADGAVTPLPPRLSPLRSIAADAAAEPPSCACSSIVADGVVCAAEAKGLEGSGMTGGDEGEVVEVAVVVVLIMGIDG